MRGAGSSPRRPRRLLTRRLVTFGVVAALVTTSATLSSVGSTPAQAESSQELRAKAARIADKIEKLGEQFTRLAESYNDAAVEAADLEVELEASAERVAALDAELGGMQQAVREFAVRMFASGGDLGGLGELLGGSGELTDRVVRDQFATLALQSGQAATNDLESKLNELNAAKRKLQRQRDAKAKLMQTLDSRKAAAEETQTKLEKLQKQTNRELQQALAEEQARREAEARARARAAARERDNSRGNGGGGNNGGGTRGGGNNGGGNGGGGNGGGGGGGGNGGGPGREVPPPSPGASGAVAAAKSQIGVPYVAFRATPGVGFDCSGLTSWAWGRAGVRLPHQSRLQHRVTERIDPADAMPGDLLFFHNPIGHVAMYLGNGLMIDASMPGRPIAIHGFRWSKVVGVGRPR